MDIYRISTIALILANAAMAVFVYSNNRKNPVNYTFAALILSITSWIFVNFMADNSTGYSALVWTKLTFVTTAVFAWLLLLFVLLFPERGKNYLCARNYYYFRPRSVFVCLC